MQESENPFRILYILSHNISHNSFSTCINTIHNMFNQKKSDLHFFGL